MLVNKSIEYSISGGQMIKKIQYLSLLTMIFCLFFANNLTARHDDWDRTALEGQTCSNGYYGMQCAAGLACEFNYGNGGNGICRRVCYTDYDCLYSETCSERGYGVGVCQTQYDNPGYPNRRAGIGERCDNNGYRYPKCKFRLVCQDWDRDGVEVCSDTSRRYPHRRREM